METVTESELHRAARSGDFEKIVRALARDDSAVNQPNYLGETPLQLAAASGSVLAVAFMLDGGADPSNIKEASPGVFEYIKMRLEVEELPALRRD